jgi:DNA modification methylase
MTSTKAQDQQGTLELEQSKKDAGPVECLGLTFENDEARREHFLSLLKEKLQDPEFRKTPGFPQGSDEAILRMSDPPYYTACPNPFLEQIVESWNEQRPESSPDRVTEPFCSDVEEGKGGRLYKAHTYHTKVPPEGIAKYILHYTQPGDIVLDVFAGSGTTGIAAALAADKKFTSGLPAESGVTGVRRVLLADLSPFATFICRGAYSNISANDFSSQAEKLIERARTALPENIYGSPESSYYIWSQVLLCPSCQADISFWDAGMNDKGNISAKFLCPNCGASTSKSKCEKATTSFFDKRISAVVTQNKYVLRKKMPLTGKSLSDTSDLDIKIYEDSCLIDGNFSPSLEMMGRSSNWGDMYRTGYHAGISHTHHFWTGRNLAVAAALWKEASDSSNPHEMKLLLTSFFVKTGSRMHNIGMKDGKINLAGQIFNTLQIPSIYAERNLFELAKGKIADLKAYFELNKPAYSCAISTCSGSSTGIPDECVDYVFVDPPFGKNIMYSEMSFLYEAWLGVITNNLKEAIESSSQSKGLDEYKSLMTQCFKEIRRVLKQGKWMTIAFHNSRNEVWNALQESVREAGFVISDVRILDKGQGTYKQMTTAGSVEKDLAISAYKPSKHLEDCLALEDTGEIGCWEFVSEHLSHIPVAVLVHGSLEVLSERTPQLLFDRMIAFHVTRKRVVPLNATEFYRGLADRYAERDGMYFLPDQVAEYDRKRISASELRQLSFFVNDEHSAIQWTRQQLQDKPQSFQDLQPQFTRELQAWNKHEKTMELKTILEQNFLVYDGRGPVPSQIHGYLSSNFKDLRNLDKENARLVDKARDRWYVPDPSKQADLERVRAKALLKQFEDIKQSNQRKIKQVRIEAIRAGFSDCWQRRDFSTIVKIAAKLADSVLLEDEKLLMYVDNSRNFIGDEA